MGCIDVIKQFGLLGKPDWQFCKLLDKCIHHLVKANSCVQCESQLKLVHSWEASESWNKSPRSCSPAALWCSSPVQQNAIKRLLQCFIHHAITMWQLLPLPFQDTAGGHDSHDLHRGDLHYPLPLLCFWGALLQLFAFHFETCTC